MNISNSKEIQFQNELLKNGFHSEDFEPNILSILKKAFKNNFDLTYLLDTKFSTEQVKELYLGLEKGLNISIYADYRISSNQMNLAKIGLIYNLNLVPYLLDKGISYADCWEILGCLRKGVDMEPLLYTSIENKQAWLSGLRKGLKKRDLIKINKNFNKKQKFCAVDFLLFGLDLSIIDNPDIKESDMLLILDELILDKFGKDNYFKISKEFSDTPGQGPYTSDKLYKEYILPYFTRKGGKPTPLGVGWIA